AAPAAGAFLAAMADDRIPVAIGLGLVVGGHLERERRAVAEGRPAIEAQAGDAQQGEAHDEHVAGLAGGVVAWRVVDCVDAAVREGVGIERGRVQRGAVEPEAYGVLGSHREFLWMRGSSSLRRTRGPPIDMPAGRRVSDTRPS